jgi:hypothetical protein
MDGPALKSLIDANASFFTPAGADDIQADGYVSTQHLINLLTGSYGTVPNSVPQGTIPAPVTILQLMQAAPTTLVALDSTTLIEIADCVKSQDIAALTTWSQILVAKTIMSSAEHTAVTTLLSQTVPDPNWSPTMPAPSFLAANGYGTDYSGVRALLLSALGRTA